MRIPIVLALLISAAIASAQESRTASPRETFEKAAFAEEHERDFQKAAGLYREAGSVAGFLGDQSLADAAMKALKRVEGRMGKGTDTAPSAQVVPVAVQRRLFLLIKDLCAPRDSGDKNLDGKNNEALNQIVPFGAVAVPMLERALNAETILDEPETSHDESFAQLEAKIREMRGTFTDNWPKLRELLELHARQVEARRQPAAPSSFRGDSVWAARALARIDVPEAQAAFLRGLKSEDPLVRQAIVENVNSEKHRAILDEALKDSNPAIVIGALRRLSRSADPALLPLMKAAIRRNDGGAYVAAEWLVNQRPDEAVALIKKPEGLNPAIVRQLVLQYSKEVPAPRREDLKGLVELAESLPDPLVAMELFQPLKQGRIGISEDLKPRVETLALRAMEKFRPEDWQSGGLTLLRTVAGIRTAEAWADMVASGRLPEAGLSRLMLPTYLAEIIEHAKPEEFVRAVEVVAKVTSDVDLEKQGDLEALSRLCNGLAALGHKGVTQEDLLAGFEKLPARLRGAYLNRVALHQKDPPAALIRNALRSSEAKLRSAALTCAARTKDPSFLQDAIAAYSDSEPNVREAAGQLIETAVAADPARGEAVIEGLLRTTDPETLTLGGYFFSMGRALPRPRLIATAERVWKDADPKRKSALLDLLLDSSNETTSELITFLVSHFDAMERAEQRRLAIQRFAGALHEPAIDLIGKALKDPSFEVRDAAQAALETFRKHREALEEFQRWKTGDAESRASISELLKLLESTNRDAVIGAVRALAAVKAKSALPALVRLIERNDPEITKAVNEAIPKIGE